METVTVRELALDVVTELAPRELPIFETVARPYLDDPRRMARALADRPDRPLGIGVEVVLGLVTPVVVLLANGAVGAVAQSAVETGYRGVRRAVVWTLRRSRVAGEVETSAVRALTADELHVIHERVEKTALTLGCDAEQARLMADSVIGALVRRAGSDPVDD
jgi:hypothetical protein